MMNSGHGGTSDEQRTGRNGSRVRQDVPETAVGLLRALRNTSVSVLYQDADLRVTWAQNVPSAWSPSSIVGMVDGDFLPPQAADRSSPRRGPSFRDLRRTVWKSAFPAWPASGKTSGTISGSMQTMSRTDPCAASSQLR